MNRYAYRMDGFDADWIAAGARRSATYTNLPPGRYTFRVRASNNDGLWNERGASVAVFIAPPWWRTRLAYTLYALLALGRTQRRAKKRAAARTTLENTLHRFETLGAPLWAQQTQAELARIGGRAPSRHQLTEAERRIAELVAQGHTNKQVAAALFLTQHSVETALTRIYRKLGVHTRSELAHHRATRT